MQANDDPRLLRAEQRLGRHDGGQQQGNSVQQDSSEHQDSDMHVEQHPDNVLHEARDSIAGDNLHPQQGGVAMDSEQDSSVVAEGSDGDGMLDALDRLGIDHDIGKWVVGAVDKDSSDMISRAKSTWDRFKLYGKRG